MIIKNQLIVPKFVAHVEVCYNTNSKLYSIIIYRTNNLRQTIIQFDSKEEANQTLQDLDTKITQYTNTNKINI